MQLRKSFTAAIALLILLSFCGCGTLPGDTPHGAVPRDTVSEKADTEKTEERETGNPGMTEPAEDTGQTPGGTDEQQKEGPVMKLKLGEQIVQVKWEDNASVEALAALCAEAPLVIRLSMYGGFEQVGPIGTSLPRDDRQTATAAGDIVLYSGDQIVIFYGSNSWAYTRLGKITNLSAEELSGMLGSGDIVITLFAE